MKRAELQLVGRLSAVGAGMTPEQQSWAVALWVEKHHGTHGPAYIAEQIGRLALAGDEAGVAMWKKIAARYSELLGESDMIAPSGRAAR